MPKRITKSQEREIIDFYKSKPMKFEVVADKFRISLPTVGKIIKKYRIKPYSKVRLFSPDLKEDFFSVIDTEEKAYFLGLIITDGCVYSKNKRQNLVSITLDKNDGYILEQFKKCLNSNKQITNDGYGCVEIHILSDRIVADLKKYGVRDNKSLNTIFPQNIPLNMYPHLVRGILDGDGSISFYARQNRRCHVKAIRFRQGNEKFLRDMVEFLHTNASVKPINLYKEKENLWSIAYRNNDSILKIFHYMYDNSTIYMKRKKELCDKVVSEIIYYHGNTEITKVV